MKSKKKDTADVGDKPEVAIIKEKEVEQPKAKSSASYKFIRNIYSSKVKVQAPVTKNSYTFEPGQAQPVDVLDVDHLLSLKRGGGGCCGHAAQERYYFELVAEI